MKKTLILCTILIFSILLNAQKSFNYNQLIGKTITLEWGEPMPILNKSTPLSSNCEENSYTQVSFTSGSIEVTRSEAIYYIVTDNNQSGIRNYDNCNHRPKNHFNFNTRNSVSYSPHYIYKITTVKVKTYHKPHNAVRTTYTTNQENLGFVIFKVKDRVLTAADFDLKIKITNGYFDYCADGLPVGNDRPTFEITNPNSVKLADIDLNALKLVWETTDNNMINAVEVNPFKTRPYDIKSTTTILAYIPEGTVMGSGSNSPLSILNRIDFTSITVIVNPIPSAPVYELTKNCAGNGSEVKLLSNLSSADDDRYYYATNGNLYPSTEITNGNKTFHVREGQPVNLFHWKSQSTNPQNCFTNKTIFAETILYPEESVITVNEICKDEVTNINLEDTESGVSYKLFKGKFQLTGQAPLETTGGSGSSFSFSNYKAGIYKLISTRLEDDNESACEVSQVIMVNNFPAYALNIDDIERCGSGGITVNAPTNNVSNFAWSKLVDGGYIDLVGKNTNVLDQNITQSESYQLKITTGDGCRFNDTIRGIVNQFPYYGAYDKTVCEGLDILDLDDQITNGVNGIWKDTNGLINGRNEILVPSAKVGETYSFNYSETNAKGCFKESNIKITIEALPIAKFKANETVCLGKIVNLDSYVNFKEGRWYDYSNNLIPVLDTLTDVGRKNYNYQYTSPNGCEYRGENVLELSTPSKPIASIGKHVFCATGDTTQIDLTASGGIAYNWQREISKDTWLKIDNSTEVINEKLLSDANYKLTPIDINSCIGDTLRFKVKINPLPIFKFKDGSLCSYQEEIELKSLISGIDTLGEYTGDGIYKNSFYKSLVSDKDTINPIYYSVGNELGCSIIDTSYIYIRSEIKPEWNATDLLCQGSESVSLNDYVRPRGGVFTEDTYITSFGIFTPPTTGVNYDVTYNYTSGYNCVESATHTIDLKEKIEYEIKINDTIVCIGDVVDLRIQNPFIGLDYTWFDDDNNIINDGIVYRATARKNPQFFHVNAQDYCGDFAKTISLASNNPLGDFWLSDSVANVGETIDFVTSIEGKYYIYDWAINGIHSSRRDFKFIFHADSTKLDVSLTVKSPQGCVFEETKHKILRLQDPERSTYSLTQQEIYDLRATYQNPTSVSQGVPVTITSKKTEIVKISLCSMDGQILLYRDYPLIQGDNVIMIPRAPNAGLFLLIMVFEDNEREMYSMLKI